MKINKLVLYNFSSFEDKNEFDFTVGEDKKNIILIGGQNGAGKTSLFSAIKVALYGPLAFGYVSSNSYYVQKIKDFINSKAFQREKVESSVTIDISIKVEREIQQYEIIRKWDYTKQKLTEEYLVCKEGKLLDEQELSYFQNYLQSIIPPDLFDFFLFDGEEVGNIFASSNYNSFVKNALFTMCEMDVFELIRKYSSNYISKTTDSSETILVDEYAVNEKKVNILTEEVDSLKEQQENVREQISNLEVELEDLEVAFRNAGGITEEKRVKLGIEFERAEKTKLEAGSKIKSFVERLMPFYIVKDFADRISNQLDYEEKGEIFYYVQQKINKQEIEDTLSKHAKLSESAIDELIDVLLNRFRPKGYSESNDPIHDLSKEEIGRVNGIFSALDSFDVENMLKIIDEKQNASNRTAEINKLLKSSMGEDEVKRFTEKENYLLKQRDMLNKELTDKESIIDKKIIELDKLKNEQAKKYQTIVDSAQNKHIYELSSGIAKMMEQLLLKKTVSIRKQLEKLTVENLHCIYRKNNLITHIEIDEDFKFSLYQNEMYDEIDLASLIRNLGNDEFVKLIGSKGKKQLLKHYALKTIPEVRKHLDENWNEKQIDLYKKIELSRLSKGERQIFILSLYWAIIKLSGQEIPFIIDTPYARIDANHRREISEKFFPSISKQVIILSTDEEINEEYYRIVKPFVAKEYLLSNDESANRTTVTNKYFYEV